MAQKKILDDFDDWYMQWKEDVNEKKSSFHSNAKSGASITGEIIRDVAKTIFNAVDTVIDKQRMPTSDKLRLEAHRRIARRVEREENRIEKKRKMIILFSIFTVLSIASIVEMPPFLPFVFAAIAVMQYFSLVEAKKKLLKLVDEFQRMQNGETPGFSNEIIEKTILRHAYQNNGKAYPEIIAVESEASLSEIDRVLKLCAEKRIANVELDSNGRAYYYFPSFDNYDPYKNLNKEQK